MGETGQVIYTVVVAIGDIYKLQLEGIAPGGDALGRFDGKPVFVEGGAPDEIILSRVVEEHKSWTRAELLEVIDPSPSRVNKTCVFYSQCGGCNLQHIEYNAQLKIKTSMLRDSFLRIGGFQPPEPEVFFSPQWEYRNRMQFHCFREKMQNENLQVRPNKSELKFGLKGRRSGEIIAVSDCPVADPGIRELLKQGGNLPLPPEKDRFNVFSIFSAGNKNAVFLNEGGNQKGKIKILEKEIFLDAGIFFQSNCIMLEKLILELRKIACSADHNLPMADLYCGVGTFAVYLSDMFPKTILAEENRKAVGIARENLKGTNVEFFALRDTDWERAFFRQRAGFGFAVADPPRTGLSSKLAAFLAQKGPPVLAYVSCDAPSLARDSKILTNHGYKLKKLMLFDFYPQTAHIESLAVFQKQ